VCQKLCKLVDVLTLKTLAKWAIFIGIT